MALTLETLHRERDPANRGRKFEKVIASIFQDADYSVATNPKTSEPRQTDLVASRNNQYFLIEVKWRSKKIDIAAIGEIRDRLNRAVPGMVGCIFSMSGYTSSAIQDVALRRQEEILLFSPQEVCLLFENPGRLQGLIFTKRRALRVDSKVHFSTGPLYRGEFGQRLPTTTRKIELNGKPQSSISIRNAGHFRDAIFISDAPNPIYLGTADPCFYVELYLNRLRLEDLGNLLASIHGIFHLSGNGPFVIKQDGVGWHGIGPECMVKELSRLEARYRNNSQKRFHHSEGIVLLETWDDGLFLLQCAHEIRQPEHLKDVVIQFRVPGIPVDASQFMEVCQFLDQPMETFRFMSPQGHWTAYPKQKKVIRLPLGKVISTELRGRGVPSIISSNPFYRGQKRLFTPMGDHSDRALMEFMAQQQVVCDLRDWLFVGDKVDRFWIERIDAFQFGCAIAVNAVTNWGKVLSRPMIPQRPDLRRCKRTAAKIRRELAFRKQMGLDEH